MLFFGLNLNQLVDLLCIRTFQLVTGGPLLFMLICCEVMAREDGRDTSRPLSELGILTMHIDRDVPSMAGALFRTSIPVVVRTKCSLGCGLAVEKGLCLTVFIVLYTGFPLLQLILNTLIAYNNGICLLGRAFYYHPLQRQRHSAHMREQYRSKSSLSMPWGTACVYISTTILYCNLGSGTCRSPPIKYRRNRNRKATKLLIT